MKAYPTRQQSIIFGVAAVLAVVILLGQSALVLLVQEDSFRAWMSDWLAPVENLLAVVALFYAARRSAIHSRRLQIAWGILALAQLAFALGDLVWAIIEGVFHLPPFPSAADGFYLAYYPLFLLGVFHLPAKRWERSELLKTLLDIGIVMLAAVLIFWNLLIGPLVVARATDSLALALSLAYPTLDLVLLLTVLVLLYRRWRTQTYAPMLLLAGSAAVQIITDGLYSYQSLSGTYTSGNLLDMGWVAGYFLAALAGVRQAVTVQPGADSEPEVKQSTWALYLPYAWLGAAFLLLIWSHDHQVPMSFPVLVVAVGVIIGLALLREIVALNENARLYARLQEELTERKRVQHRMTRLNECLLSFSSNPDENISRLVGLCGELMGATFALYNRLQGALLYSLGQWNTPPEYERLGRAEGRICHDVIRQGTGAPVVIRDLQHTPYAQTDPNVARCNLRTYVGAPVQWNQVVGGSLCVVYQADAEPNREDLELMSIIASAISVEEERKRKYEVLRVSEEKHRTLCEASTDAIFIETLEGSVLDCNASACEMFGYRKEELIGLTVADLVPVEVKATLSEVIRGKLETGGIRVETFTKRKNGEVFPCEVSTRLITLGGEQRVIAYVRDITHRRQAEDALRAQKRLFEDLVTVARATAERPTLEATLQNALNVAAVLTGAEDGDLILLNEAGAITRCIMFCGAENRELWHDIALRVMDRGLAGWVAKHRQAALVADTSRDERWLLVPELPLAIRSALSVPIVSGSTLAGILTLTHSRPEHFDEEHLHLMLAAADQMALAVRNAQIYDAQRRMADRQITLYEVLRAVSRQLDPDAVARQATEAIARLTHWANVHIALLDEKQTHWVIQAASGDLSSVAGMTFSIHQGVSGRALRTKQAQVVLDVRTDSDYIAAHPDIRSELAVPLRRGDRVLGVLNIESDRLGAFSDEDVRLAESLAEAVALALDNARLYAEARHELGERKRAEEKLARRALELGALYETSLEINAQPDLSTLLRAIVERATSLLGARMGGLYLMNPDGQSLRLVVAHNLPGDYVGTILRLGEGLSGRIAQTGKPSMIADYRHWEDRAMVYDRERFRRVLGVPLKVKGKVIGVINITDDERTGTFSEEEVRLVSLFADQAAIAVENTRLYEETNRLRAFNENIVCNMEEGILLENQAGHITFINPQMTELLGYAPEELIGRHWTAIVSPESVAGVEKEATQRPRGIANRYETVLMTKASRQVPVIVSARPLFEEGEFIGVLSVFTEITERKQAEEALRESETRYRAIVEDQTEFICRWRPDGALTFVNDAYCRCFGKTREELIGHSFIPLIHEEDRRFVENQVALLTPENPVVTFEHRVTLPNGMIRWQEWTDRLICDEQGRPLEFQSVGRDVTERRQAEERLVYLSTHDNLTGLHNRAYFEGEIARVEQRQRFPVSIVIGDVDGLKEVNDARGHAAGDQLLRRAAQVLRSAFRSDDVIARIGGDEFAVLLPETDATAAKQTVSRIRQKVEVHNRDYRGFLLSFSLGVATGDEERPVIEVMREADERMYKAKFLKSHGGQGIASPETNRTS